MDDQSDWIIVLNQVVDGLNARFDQQDKIIEGLEQTIALLTTGYGEMAVMIEALIARVGSGSPEELEAFKADAAEGKKQLLSMLSAFTTTAANTPTDSEKHNEENI